MTDVTAEEIPPSGRGRSGLILAAMVLIAGLGAFAAGFLGVVQPSKLLAGWAGPKVEHITPGYVEVPRITLPLPGRDRQLVMGIMLETTTDRVPGIESQMPRILDSYNGFLSGIDPGALDRRGVLEIIRAELQARTDMLLGGAGTGEVLITEFAIL
ncbi:MAG: flagellar basal body-associated FliL family protein [Paracoccus sp. (in: a-proteobacteria)]|nr:flagellar basal body-associated FliL family protein [Paracoccus sp. (in: a-proteobacteria)]